MRTLVPVSSPPHGFSLMKVLFPLGFLFFMMLTSLHYYHTANVTREASIMLSKLSTISNAVGQLKGTVLSANSITAAVPSESWISPWGARVSVEDVSNEAYTVKIPLTPAKVCKLIKKEMKENPHLLADATTCPHSGSVTYLYTVV